MCGRFVLGEYSWAEYHDSLSIIRGEEDAQRETGFNIAPTQQVAMVVKTGDELVVDHARWWFIPRWHRGDPKEWKGTTFNARIETAAHKPTFRDAWKHGRCVIPASGYYEWTGPRGHRQPWFISLESEPVFYFMGLYSTLADGTRTCAIVTRDAAVEIASIHDRMPVILTLDEVRAWLDHADGDDVVVENYGLGWTGRYLARQVAPFGARDDGPRLIQPRDKLF